MNYIHQCFWIYFLSSIEFTWIPFRTIAIIKTKIICFHKYTMAWKSACLNECVMKWFKTVILMQVYFHTGFVFTGLPNFYFCWKVPIRIKRYIKIIVTLSKNTKQGIDQTVFFFLQKFFSLIIAKITANIKPNKSSFILL